MINLHSRDGYTFLLSILFVGAIATAVTGTMLLLGWLALRNSDTAERSAKAYELARTCAEVALEELFEDNAYLGNEELSLSQGLCYILPIGGTGNENRTVCTEGESGGTVRRLEIILDHILPSIEIIAWQEVEFFTSCSYE
jgi:hypothetical protein